MHLLVVHPIEVGRDCAGVLLTDPKTSRRHLRLHVSGGKVIVTDLGSTNGTTINGEKLTGPTPLDESARVLLGDTSIELRTDEQVGAPAYRLHDTITVLEKGVPTTPVRVAAGAGAGAAEIDPFTTTSIDLIAASIVEDPNSLTQTGLEPGTVTIVFSDIESSTERAAGMGDRAWMQLLATHNRLVEHQVRRHGGDVVKSQGDGFMLTFTSARAAVRCMSAVQRDLATHNETNPADQIHVRIGIHTGEAIFDEGDLYGLHVNMAARVAGEALGGEILVSSLVRQIIEPRGDIEFGLPRFAELKGLRGQHELSPIIWE